VNQFQGKSRFLHPTNMIKTWKMIMAFLKDSINIGGKHFSSYDFEGWIKEQERINEHNQKIKKELEKKIRINRIRDIFKRISEDSKYIFPHLYSTLNVDQSTSRVAGEQMHSGQESSIFALRIHSIS